MGLVSAGAGIRLELQQKFAVFPLPVRFSDCQFALVVLFESFSMPETGSFNCRIDTKEGYPLTLVDRLLDTVEIWKRN